MGSEKRNTHLLGAINGLGMPSAIADKRVVRLNAIKTTHFEIIRCEFYHDEPIHSIASAKR